MAKYVLKYNELVELETTQLQTELDQLEKWLHSTGIDSDFDQKEHLHIRTDSGDRWLFLPELTERELFAMSLILSSSELYHDTSPVRFDKPPYSKQDDAV